MSNNIRTKIVKGMLDVIVLGIIHGKPIHGYRIIKTIQKRYSVYLGASTIYPLLNDLEKKGYVKSEWVQPTLEFHTWQKKKAIREGKFISRPRKIYIITEQGKDMLANNQTELELIVKPLIELKA